MPSAPVDIDIGYSSEERLLRQANVNSPSVRTVHSFVWCSVRHPRTFNRKTLTKSELSSSVGRVCCELILQCLSFVVLTALLLDIKPLVLFASDCLLEAVGAINDQ
ncbi:hypothetical protein PoB_000066100 [Plakobranchus ocellatus]|uniref:Uncharacterized protein n=1 Tax=Plakobranchus ocellatus TaxID=259542 RepID=A0AAV3XVT4_9GAST|nr:hypothetical protein PoB_000066100 [Plakobranchus ocellatus]